MKNSKRTSATLKGAVLIMVMTIMFVLIFLLAGTIAVVYSAHNRAMVKYEESQAYYTARSVLDTFIESMMKSNDVTDASGQPVFDSTAKYYYLEEDTAPGNVFGYKQSNVGNNAISYGRALELDLYKVPISLEVDAVANPDYNKWLDERINGNGGTLHTAVASGDTWKYNMNIGQAPFSGVDNSVKEYFEQYSVAADWNVNNSTTETGSGGVTGTSAKNVVTYQFLTNIADYQQSNSGDSFGSNKLADADPATAGQSLVTIKVEMLEREYDLGSGSTPIEQFMNGDRSKDHMKFKLTSTVTLNGEETTTSAIFENTDVTPPPSSNAIVSLTDIGHNASLVAIGGASSLTHGFTQWTNNSVTAGNVNMRGGFGTGSTNPNLHLTQSDILVSHNTIKIENNVNTGSIKNGGTIYAKNIEFADNKAQFQDGSNKPNFIAYDTFKINDTGARAYGKIMATTFYPTFSSNCNGAQVFSDDIYCAYLGVEQSKVNIATVGDATTITFITGGDQNGNTLNAVNKELHIHDGIKVFDNAGNVVGTYEFVNGTKTTALDLSGYPADTQARIKYGSGEPKVELQFNPYDDPYNPGTEKKDFTVNADYQKVFQLPVNPVGKTDKELKLDTPRSLYSQYFHDTTAGYGGTFDGDTWNLNCDFNTVFGGTTYTYEDASTGGDTADYIAMIQEHVKSAEYWKDGPDDDSTPESNFTNNLFVCTSELTWSAGGGDTVGGVDMPAHDKVVSASGYLKATQQPNGSNYIGTVFIDARDHAINIQMGDGNPTPWQSDPKQNFYGKFVVYGDNPVNVYVPGITGVSNATVQFGDSGFAFSFVDADLVVNGNADSLIDTITIGGTAPTPPPNINYYVSKNVSMIKADRDDFMLMGYMTAPNTEVEIATSGNGRTLNHCNYYGKDITGTKLFVIGNVFAKKYVGGQHSGVLYIDNSNNNQDHGKRLFAWANVLFTNG